MIEFESDYSRRALRYAEDVTSGKIVAGDLTRRACARFIGDLKKKKFRFEFSEENAARACIFIETLPHVKGEWAGKLLILEDWQCFIVCNLFGWVDRKTRFRRFRTCYLEVARKNAKSTLSSAIALYMATADGEPGADCYSAATTKKQAEIVFGDAAKMAKKSQAFRDAYGVRVYKSLLTAIDGENKFEPVSAEAKNLDGLNPHYASVDEIHAHRTRAVFDVIETAMGARTQSLLSIITTAGFDIHGIGYELHTYAEKILLGIFEDDSFFAMIYTCDPDDDPFSELAWMKANPNYGISVKPDFLENLARKAKRAMSARVNFMTKHLNMWVKSDKRWLAPDKWKKCADPEMTIEQFRGLPCIIAVDLASKIDVAALLILFQVEGIFYEFPYFYLPADAVDDRAEETFANYKTWADEGIFQLTPGNVIDFGFIKQDIKDFCRQFDVEAIVFDPFQATQIMTELTAEGLPVEEMGATVRNFSEPMKELEALIHSCKIRHANNPAMNWMMSNVVAHLDKKDNIFPNKERKEDKIDGAVALIMAIARAIFSEGNNKSVYETRGLDTV